MRDFIKKVSLNGKVTQQEKEQFIKLSGLVEVHVKNENPLAVACFLSLFSEFCPDKNIKIRFILARRA